MARKRGKKALYEVMSKGRLKPTYEKKIEPLRPKELDKAQPSTAKPDVSTFEKPPRWRIRPKPVQINAGRIELSMPYQLAIAVLLGVVLLMLISFRVGYRLGRGGQKAANPAGRVENRSSDDAVGRAEVAAGGVRESPERASPVSERIEPPKPTGNNRIVIQTYLIRAHLEPVKEYFDKLGIQTEIRKIGERYYLVTSNKYEDTDRPGTDGYTVKRRIIELGPKYKAPPGYETFAPNLFTDAYGMRFND